MAKGGADMMIIYQIHIDYQLLLRQNDQKLKVTNGFILLHLSGFHGGGGGNLGYPPPKENFPPPKILLIQLFNRFEFHNSNTIRTKTR